VAARRYPPAEAARNGIEETSGGLISRACKCLGVTVLGSTIKSVTTG
jgi:hypothetical protein